MESQIKIHFSETPKGILPTLNIRFQDSADPRDALIKSFFKQLGSRSQWLRISFDHHLIKGETEKFGQVVYATIYPITDADLLPLITEVKDAVANLSFENAPTNGNPFNVERQYPLIDHRITPEEALKSERDKKNEPTKKAFEKKSQGRRSR